MLKSLRKLALLLVAAVCLPTFAQMVPLPIDPAVRYGKLPNGLTYYIRHNALPEKQANFYIAQRVGSVQEEESQRGLAHFLEHMCFNGTTHFPGDRIIKYTETIGVRFGQNLNAYTSTDETVYNIDDVPVTEANIDSCLLILHDWANDLILAPEEIDKERGVIHEEWRMRSSATMRIFERNLKTLFPGSRYGERMPIGLMSVVDNFKPEELRAYYEKWYRPDLQGIIVVGDIDVDQVESKVKALFSPIEMPANAAPYELYPVPDNDEPIYIVDKDKEQSQGIILVNFKHEAIPAEVRGTPAFLAMSYINKIITAVMNERFSDLSKKADCAFIGAYADDGNYVGLAKTAGAFDLAIVPKPGKDAEAVKEVMTEIARIHQHGFNASEVIRARDEHLSRFERIYDNRDKQTNDFYVPQYVRHFLEGNAIPDIETEFQLTKMMAQQLPTETFAAMATEYTASIDTNFVVLGMYPEKDGVEVPSVESLKAAVEAGYNAQTEALAEEVNNEPLISQLPKPGKIKSESEAQFGYKKWTLANGANVFFKQTDFDDAQVLVSAASFGGTNYVATEDLLNAEVLDNVMNSTGLGAFTQSALEKKLAGKQAQLSVSLAQLSDRLDGSSTPKDLRTLFELIYLRFQKPGVDQESFDNFIAGTRTALLNAEKQPMVAFSDSLSSTLYAHSPRHQRMKLADVDKISYDRIRQLYSERFASAGDFDFYFTGAFNEDSLRAFVEQYIAPLPGVKNREALKVLKKDEAQGVVDNHFSRQMETPQAIIVQIWHGEAPYSLKTEAVANVLAEVLTQRYLKSIREDAGYAYSVGAYASVTYGERDAYRLIVQCPMRPATRDSVLILMDEGINDIAKGGVTTEEMDKVKAFEAKEYEANQKKNSYWSDLIQNYVRFGKDGHNGYVETVNSVTSDDVRAFVNDVLLRQRNRVTVSMLPEDFSEAEAQ